MERNNLDYVERLLCAAGRVDSLIARSTVTLWAAGELTPAKLLETATGEEGAFRLDFDIQKAGGNVLYLTASGGEPMIAGLMANSAIVLMATLGTAVPERVTLNELTTVLPPGRGGAASQRGVTDAASTRYCVPPLQRLSIVVARRDPAQRSE